MAMKIIQGQGDGTEYKERRLGAAFYVNAVISARNKTLSRYPYIHADLYCGSGFNDLARCNGSPIAFLDAMREAGKHDFHAWFVDINRSAIEALTDRIGHELRATILEQDNREFIAQIPSLIAKAGERPQYAIGSVLIDPNGYIVPWSALNWLSIQCPRLDIIVNYNATAIKRMIGLTSATDFQAQHEIVRLNDVPARLNKKHVLICSPVGSANQFVLLICSNSKRGDHKALGFYHWDSEEGKAIRRKCGYTKSERETFPAQKPLDLEAAS